MTVPSSGELSLGKIRQELETSDYSAGPYTANATSLSGSETGLYATVNTGSPSYPDGIFPFEMSEWYDYDQNATGSSGAMPTITGYTATPASTTISGVVFPTNPAISYVKLTNKKYIGIAVPNAGGTSTVYAHGIDWSSASPTVNSFTSVSTNGFVRSGRNAGIAIVRLTNTKALTFYQNGTSSTRYQILKYVGGTTSVSVEATGTISGNGGYSSGRAIVFATNGNIHYIALSSANPTTSNFDSYVKIYKVNYSTNTVTYITQGQIHQGADNSCDVTSFGEISTNTYGLLGTSLRNTTFYGALAYATMKFNISTETLTVSSNLNTLQASAISPTYTSPTGVNIATNEIILFYQINGGNNYQATINYDGTTTTVENNSVDSGTPAFIPRSLAHYLLDGYNTPEDQMINVFTLTASSFSYRVETVVYDSATHQWTRQGDQTQIEANDATQNGVHGVFVLLKDPDNAMLIWCDVVNDRFEYNTFTIDN